METGSERPVAEEEEPGPANNCASRLGCECRRPVSKSDSAKVRLSSEPPLMNCEKSGMKMDRACGAVDEDCGTSLCGSFPFSPFPSFSFPASDSLKV